MIKLILFFLISFFISVISQSQIVQSSCIAHDSIVAKYKTDADRLAVRDIFATNSNYMYDIAIDQNRSDRILRALISIYNVANIPERDEVIDSFDVQTYFNPSLTSFSVKADSNELWMQNIKNGIMPTGNAIVDSLSDVYNLSVFNYYDWSFSSSHSVTFKSDDNLNLKPLTLMFLDVSGVHNAFFI